MSKIAVIFPGIGYNADKPLLYHAGKLAASFGYEVIRISYPACDVNLKTADSSQIGAFVGDCLETVQRSLDTVSLKEADGILFISKSIGTAIAAAYATTLDLHIDHIYFTPLEETFKYAAPESGIAFNGDSDPWADHNVIRRLCGEKRIPLTTFEGANHSLETGDVLADIETLGTVMTAVKKHIKSV